MKINPSTPLAILGCVTGHLVGKNSKPATFSRALAISVTLISGAYLGDRVKDFLAEAVKNLIFRSAAPQNLIDDSLTDFGKTLVRKVIAIRSFMLKNACVLTMGSALAFINVMHFAVPFILTRSSPQPNFGSGIPDGYKMAAGGAIGLVVPLVCYYGSSALVNK